MNYPLDVGDDFKPITYGLDNLSREEDFDFAIHFGMREEHLPTLRRLQTYHISYAVDGDGWEEWGQSRDSLSNRLSGTDVFHVIVYVVGNPEWVADKIDTLYRDWMVPLREPSKYDMLLVVTDPKSWNTGHLSLVRMAAPLPPLPFVAGDTRFVNSLVRPGETWLSVDREVDDGLPSDAIAITVGGGGDGMAHDVIVSRRDLLDALGVKVR